MIVEARHGALEAKARPVVDPVNLLRLRKDQNQRPAAEAIRDVDGRSTAAQADQLAATSFEDQRLAAVTRQRGVGVLDELPIEYDGGKQRTFVTRRRGTRRRLPLAIACQARPVESRGVALPVPGQIDHKLIGGGCSPAESAAPQLRQIDDAPAIRAEFAGNAVIPGFAARIDEYSVGARVRIAEVLAPYAAKAAVLRYVDVEVQLGAREGRVGIGCMPRRLPFACRNPGFLGERAGGRDGPDKKR